MLAAGRGKLVVFNTHYHIPVVKLSGLVILDSGHASFTELWLAHGASAALARVGCL